MSSPSFLPANYEVPSTGGNYFKPEEGIHTIRVVSLQPVIGWTYWNTANKPIRLREDPKAPPADLRTGGKFADKVKHFWAFTVYNYELQRLQIWEVTQVTIMGVLKGLAENAKWGHPGNYDLDVTKAVNGDKTTWTITPNPPSKMDPAIKDMVKATPINLELLFDGLDPFGNETLGQFAQAAAQPVAVKKPVPQVGAKPASKAAPAPVPATIADAPEEEEELPF